MGSSEQESIALLDDNCKFDDMEEQLAIQYTVFVDVPRDRNQCHQQLEGGDLPVWIARHDDAGRPPAPIAHSAFPATLHAK